MILFEDSAPVETESKPEVVLVDLSSIAHPIWHMVQSDPDPNRTSIQTVAKVRALATGQAHVAVCCDSGRSFRAELDPSYKANRPESDATLQHQITLARETLVADGFPVWAVRGFEADDLIATGTRLALEAGQKVLIATADKDLLQLVGEHVKVKSLRDGSVIEPPGVMERFGVSPGQMGDYLSLVGDASDNVKGAKGIGPKKAAAILEKFGTLEFLYDDLDENGALGLAKKGIKPAELESLNEFRTRWPIVRKLIALRDDVEIPFSEVFAERIPKDAATFNMEEEPVEEIEAPAESTPPKVADPVKPTNGEPPPSLVNGAIPSAALAVREVEVLPPSEWERQLDPRSMKDARTLAQDLFASRMFSAYGTPQAVLSTIMVGRELGLPAMASLRSINNIEGKHSLSAALMVALVLKSGMAEYFRPVTDDQGNLEMDEKHATFETLRKGPGNRPVKLTYTIEEAKTAGLLKEKSGWVKNPKPMLVARAQSTLVRLVYPDLMAGLYTPEELTDAREQGNAA